MLHTVAWSEPPDVSRPIDLPIIHPLPDRTGCHHGRATSPVEATPVPEQPGAVDPRNDQTVGSTWPGGWPTPEPGSAPEPTRATSPCCGSEPSLDAGPGRRVVAADPDQDPPGRADRHGPGH